MIGEIGERPVAAQTHACPVSIAEPSHMAFLGGGGEFGRIPLFPQPSISLFSALCPARSLFGFAFRKEVLLVPIGTIKPLMIVSSILIPRFRH